MVDTLEGFAQDGIEWFTGSRHFQLAGPNAAKIPLDNFSHSLFGTQLLFVAKPSY